MKIKEIWAFIKNVIWPAAKPFICASREEAEEVVSIWRSANFAQAKESKSLIIPSFILRCIDALENEQTPRQNDPVPAPKPKINGFVVWPSDWWKD